MPRSSRVPRASSKFTSSPLLIASIPTPTRGRSAAAAPRRLGSRLASRRVRRREPSRGPAAPKGAYRTLRRRWLRTTGIVPGAASAIACSPADRNARRRGRCDRKRVRNCASASPCGENGVDIASRELAGPHRMTRPNDGEVADATRPERHLGVGPRVGWISTKWAGSVEPGQRRR
jgi:hypothetical protein